MRRKMVSGVAAALALSAASVAHGQGIPVIDTASITKQTEEWIKQAQRWQEELNQYHQMIKQQADQLAAQTGVRDISKFMKEVKRQYDQVKDLTKWVQNPHAILTQGKDILTDDLKDIFDSYDITSSCQQLEGNEKKLCEGKIVLTTVQQKVNEDLLNSVDERVNTINDISARMANAKDVKESMDLNNALQAQIAQLNADKLKLEIQMAADANNERLTEQKQHEEVMRNTMKNFNGKTLFQ